MLNISTTPQLSETRTDSKFYYVMLSATAPDLGGPNGPRPKAPHHVHMFSPIRDMCVPLDPFYRGKFVCRRY